MPQTTRDWQRALFIPLTILAWLVLVVIGVWLLAHVTKTILTLVLSAIVAFALTPLVRFFSRYMPRGYAIALAYLLGFTVILGFLSFLIYTAAEQVSVLVSDLPSYMKKSDPLKPHILQILHPFGVSSSQYDSTKAQAVHELQNVGKTLAVQSIDIITSVLGTLIDVILVLILSVYVTVDGERLARRFRERIPGAQRRNVTILFAIVNQVVGGYIRGALALALLIGVLVGAGMYIIGVHKFAVLLGVLAFFMEFIPVIGVLVSGALSIALGFLNGWVTAVIVLVYFVFVHIIEGDVVGPRIMGRAVGIHPATALVALVAGTELFGIWGALFAAPIAGLLQAIGTAIWREMTGGDPADVVSAVIEAGKPDSHLQAHHDPEGPQPPEPENPGNRPVTE